MTEAHPLCYRGARPDLTLLTRQGLVDPTLPAAVMVWLTGGDVGGGGVEVITGKREMAATVVALQGICGNRGGD